MRSVSSLILVGLSQEKFVALGLPLKVANIILGCIFSMLFSDFRARGPISIPTPPIVALTEFFHADAVASVHPLPISWYLISSLWVYPCSYMQIMSMLWSIADAVRSGSFPILFKVLIFNIAICIVRLYFSNFCCLSSVADFRTLRPGLQPQQDAPFFLPVQRATRFGSVLWVSVVVIFRWLFIFLSIEATLIDEKQ